MRMVFQSQFSLTRCQQTSEFNANTEWKGVIRQRILKEATRVSFGLSHGGLPGCVGLGTKPPKGGCLDQWEVSHNPGSSTSASQKTESRGARTGFSLEVARFGEAESC